MSWHSVADGEGGTADESSPSPFSSPLLSDGCCCGCIRFSLRPHSHCTGVSAMECCQRRMGMADLRAAGHGHDERGLLLLLRFDCDRLQRQQTTPTLLRSADCRQVVDGSQRGRPNESCCSDGD